VEAKLGSEGLLWITTYLWVVVAGIAGGLWRGMSWGLHVCRVSAEPFFLRLPGLNIKGGDGLPQKIIDSLVEHHRSIRDDISIIPCEKVEKHDLERGLIFFLCSFLPLFLVRSPANIYKLRYWYFFQGGG